MNVVLKILRYIIIIPFYILAIPITLIVYLLLEEEPIFDDYMRILNGVFKIGY